MSALAGRWTHDPAEIEELPPQSLSSDRHGTDYERGDYWHSPATDWPATTKDIDLPAYIWRVGPARKWEGVPDEDH